MNPEEENRHLIINLGHAYDEIHHLRETNRVLKEILKEIVDQIHCGTDIIDDIIDDCREVEE